MTNYFGHCMTREQLEQEHRRLVIQLHPDRNPDNPNATADFQEMQAQYEERKAELNGDYTKARKGRERREREERERREREAKEQARRKVEQAIEQARRNRPRNHNDLKAGEYLYARKTQGESNGSWNIEQLLRHVLCNGVYDECVVKIEDIITMSDEDFMTARFSDMKEDYHIYGGWEILQQADPARGVKAKRVAKVVLFRSEHYYMLGNFMGDNVISDYYMPPHYELMYSDHLHRILADITRENAEREQREAERKAKILAEQQPLIDEWQAKLISVSAGLTARECEAVAIDNLKKVLKEKFPGTRFTIKVNRYGEASLSWEDGPTEKDMVTATDLFNTWLRHDLTPWQLRFGALSISYGDYNRKMSVLTKAKILQQLGSVTEAFGQSQLNDSVTLSEFDWMMLHATVGIDINATDEALCMSAPQPDGTHIVNVMTALRFVFMHTSYIKTAKRKKK